MKKLFGGLIVLLIIYITIRCAFIYFSNGHDITYNLTDNDYIANIHETAIFDSKDNYYFEVAINNKKFTFQTFYDFKKSSKVIKEIKYYEDDNVSCILPVYIGDVIISDVLCIYEGQYNYYHNMSYSNNNFTSFIKELQKYGYDESKYLSLDDEKVINYNNLLIYSNNLVDGHIVGLSNYKGIYTIEKDSDIFSSELFSTDIYSNKVSILKDNYYLSAIYNKANGFKEMYLVDYVNHVKSKLEMPQTLSYESYFHGYHDLKLYLIDMENKIQYEIDLDKKTVKQVGNMESGIVYYEGNKKKRIEYNNSLDNINFLEGTQNNKYGYIYTFEKINNKYGVYRENVQNKDNKVFIFETNDINRIVYMDEYIYYISEDKLNYYSDYTGEKTILINSEFKYNDTLKYNVYEK